MKSLGLGGLFLCIPHWINIECLPCASRQCTVILEAERWDQNRHSSMLSRNTETHLTIQDRKMLWEQTETFTSPENCVRRHRLFIVITKFRCTCWKGIYQGKREGKFQAGKTVFGRFYGREKLVLSRSEKCPIWDVSIRGQRALKWK